MVKSAKKAIKPVNQSNWRPDWKDASQYAYLKGASPRQLAWEFLRRNPQYHLKFQELQKLPISSIADRMNLNRERDKLENEFGIKGICSPFVKPPPIPIFKEPYVPIWDKPGELASPIIYLNENEVIISFDLNKPIEHLISVAKVALKQRQKRKPKTTRTHEFLTYLRVLDAKASTPQPSNYDIAIAIGYNPNKDSGDRPAEKFIDNAYRKAREWCDDKYRLLSYCLT